MRRIILALVMLAILVASALPAMAQNRGNDDGVDYNWEDYIWGDASYNNDWDDDYNDDYDDYDWNNNVWCGPFPSWEGLSYWCYSPLWGWWELS